MSSSSSSSSFSASDLAPCLTALTALKSALSSLDQALEGSRAIAFDLPRVRDPGQGEEAALQACIENQDGGEEREELDLWDQVIPVEEIEGAKGSQLCRSALLKVTRRRDQPPTRPDRRPGLLWVPGKAGAGVRRAARTVNDLKEAFRAAVNAVGTTAAQRAARFHGTPLQHVMLIQAYRKIQVIGCDVQMDARDPTRVLREVPWDVEAVSFSWSGASRKVLTLSRDQVLDYITNRKLFGWTSAWERRVLETEDERFAMVRRLPPFPIANLKSEGKWCKRVMAPVPLIYTGEQWPQIRALPDYQPGAEPGLRNQGAVEIEPVALIPEIHLHRYLHADAPA